MSNMANNSTVSSLIDQQDEMLNKYGINSIIGMDIHHGLLLSAPSSATQATGGAGGGGNAWDNVNLRLGNSWNITMEDNYKPSSKARVCFKGTQRREHRHTVNVSIFDIPVNRLANALPRLTAVQRASVLVHVIDYLKKAIFNNENTLLELTTSFGAGNPAHDVRRAAIRNAVTIMFFPHLLTGNQVQITPRLTRRSMGSHVVVTPGARPGFAISMYYKGRVAHIAPWTLLPSMPMSPASDLAAVAGAANVVADWSNINLSDFQNSDTESSLEQKKKALNWTRNAVQHAVNNEHLIVGAVTFQVLVNRYLAQHVRGVTGIPIKTSQFGNEIEIAFVVNPASGINLADVSLYGIAKPRGTDPNNVILPFARIPHSAFPNLNTAQKYALILKPRIIAMYQSRGERAVVKHTRALALHLVQHGYLEDEIFNDDGFDGCSEEETLVNVHNCYKCDGSVLCVDAGYNAASEQYICDICLRSNVAPRIPAQNATDGGSRVPAQQATAGGPRAPTRLGGPAANLSATLQRALKRSYNSAATMMGPSSSLNLFGAVQANRVDGNGKVLDYMLKVPIPDSSTNARLRPHLSSGSKICLSDDGKKVVSLNTKTACFVVAGIGGSSGNGGIVNRALTLLCLLIKHCQARLRSVLQESEILLTADADAISSLIDKLEAWKIEMLADADACAATERRLPHLRKERSTTPLSAVQVAIGSMKAFEEKYLAANSRCLSHIQVPALLTPAVEVEAESSQTYPCSENWKKCHSELATKHGVNAQESSTDVSFMTVQPLHDSTWASADKIYKKRQSTNATLCDRGRVDKFASSGAYHGFVIASDGLDHGTDVPFTTNQRSPRSLTIAHMHDHRQTAFTGFKSLEPQSLAQDYDESVTNGIGETSAHNLMRSNASADEFTEFVQFAWDAADLHKWQILSQSGLSDDLNKYLPKKVVFEPKDVWAAGCIV